ncbi:MAG: hypothetical protein J0L97_10165 [Alphaproteobacteria bacterium]|nr:hypothetical protein [Alphaproteobacteria bacterium]
MIPLAHFKRFSLQDGNTLDVQHCGDQVYMHLSLDNRDVASYENLLAARDARGRVDELKRVHAARTVFGFEIHGYPDNNQRICLVRLCEAGKLSQGMANIIMNYISNKDDALTDRDPYEYYAKVHLIAEPRGSGKATYFSPPSLAV